MSRSTAYAALAGLVIFGVSAGGCSRADVVATIGTETITADEFVQAWQASPFAPHNPSIEMRRRFLEGLIRMHVLALEAKKETLVPAEGPTTAALSFSYEKKLREDLKPNDEDVHAFYLKHMDIYKEPLETGNIIVVPTLEQAQTIKTLLSAGLSFDDARAQALGLKAPQTQSATQITPFRKGERLTNYTDFFFAVAPGQTSGILHLQMGYVILHRGQPQKDVPYPDIENDIRNSLTEFAVQKKINDLVAAAPVSIDEKALSGLPL